MSSDRLTGSDKRALLLWILLGIVGAVFAYKFYFRAFPEASVDLQVSRGEAEERAKDFVTSLNENITGYRTAVEFSVEDESKTFLERKLGLERANQLMASQAVSVWYWDVRFFRPQQEEEFHVHVSPAGNIVGYEHKVPEKLAGASADRASAQLAVETFLRSKLNIDLSAWDFLSEEANSTKRPNRVDWSFTWERRSFRPADAPYRLTAVLQGDRTGGAGTYLQIPEEWKRSYAKLRSSNDTLEQVFLLPYLILLGAAIRLAIVYTKRGQTSWRGAIILGIVATALLFLQGLNEWPHWASSYDTNTSYSSFLVLKVASALLLALVTAITVTLVLPAAEPLYRASQPDRLRLSQVLTKRGLRSKEFFSGAIVGLSFAAAHIGYVVAFYIIASKLGAWAPQEIDFDNSVNTAFPWISGAAIGLLASTNEEFTFRLFAIPFFARLTRMRWLAVILPAFMWSFLHSNYPQEPAYIRGIEIGLIGIVAGIVMLRWGILATLIWHYTVDASLVGLLLIRSNSVYFKVSGVIVALAAVAPLLYAGISYLTRGGFESDEDLRNSAAPVDEATLTDTSTPEVATTTSRSYDALAPGMLGFLTACFLVGGFLAWHLRTPVIGDYLRLSLDIHSAQARADEIVKQRGLSPGAYVHATTLVNVSDPTTNEFLWERIGVKGTNDIYAGKIPAVLWRVRYFQDGQPEEYAVVLKPDGSLHSIHHTLAESASGASLTKDEAVARAEQYLREEKKLDLSQWSLVESNSDKRPHRIDHTLTWQQNAPLDSAADALPGVDANLHAYARFDLTVHGDEVTNYRTYIKIPEDWRRDKEALTLPRILLGYPLAIVIFLTLGVAALIIFLKNLRSDAARAVPWKRLFRWASWVFLAFPLVFTCGDRIPALLAQYTTAVPFAAMKFLIFFGALLGVSFTFALLLLAFGLAWYYAKRAFGDERIPGWGGMPNAYYRDALWIGLGGVAGLLGLRALIAAAAPHWPTVHRSIDASFNPDLGAYLPAGLAVGSSLQRGLFAVGLVMLLASFVGAQLRPRWLRFVTFLLGSLSLAVLGGDWGSPADLLKRFVASMILLGAGVFFVRRVVRFNLLGLFLGFVFLGLFGAATRLMAQPDHFYKLNGYAIVVLLSLAAAWPIVLWLGKTKIAAGFAPSNQ